MVVNMRAAVADSSEDVLLTTGEAAKLLGTSRQHVVNLCASGDLPYVVVGTHRRVSRSDVEALRAGGQRMARDQARSLWLAHAIAGRLVESPEPVLAQARENLERAMTSRSRGATRYWADQWVRLLDGPLEPILLALTSPSLRSRDLRQNNPFAGVLSEDDRARLLQSFDRLHPRTRRTHARPVRTPDESRPTVVMESMDPMPAAHLGPGSDGRAAASPR
jgi:excisionase family DNA binding protein